MQFARRKSRNGSGGLASGPIVATLFSAVLLTGCATYDRKLILRDDETSSFSSSYAAVPVQGAAKRKIAERPTDSIYFKAAPQQPRPIPAAFAPLPFDPCQPSEPTSVKPYGSTILKGQKTLRDAANYLDSQISYGGYLRLSYFRCPDGFVLMTSLEWFEKDGTPNQIDRWVSDNFALPRSGDIWHDFWYGREGRFRGFLISVRNSHSTIPEAPSAEDLKSIFTRGRSSLDPTIENMPITEKTRITASMYVFEARKGKMIHFIDSTTVPIAVHLAKTGIVLGGK
jgi:hypothetical protein